MPAKDLSPTYSQRKGANAAPARTCKFIEGERPYGDDPYCGKKAIEESSYCEHHHRRTHITMDPLRSRAFTSHSEFIARISK